MLARLAGPDEPARLEAARRAAEEAAPDDRQSRRREALLRTLQTGALRLAERRRQALVWRDELGHALADARRRLAELRNPPRGVEGTSPADPT